MVKHEPLGSPGHMTAVDEIGLPFDVVAPQEAIGPMVLSSPHSGCVYPARFLAAARLDAFALRRSEDAFVDELFSGATQSGAPLLRARFPRAFLDVNREPYELDPRMFEGRLPGYVNTRSVRVAGGLGTIARVVGEAQEIYAGPLSVAEGLERVERLYKPYHAALRGLIDAAHRTFGVALLVDCHSMPSVPTMAGPSDRRISADFVVGDRYGTSCHPLLVQRLERVIRDCGYTVQRNKPYAGDYITEHYGTPQSGVHSIQIELNRSLYMDERTLTRTTQFAAVRASLGEIMRHLADAALSLARPSQAAAE